MSKEVKIGLSVIGILLLVFGTLLFRRLTALDAPSDALQGEAAAAAASPGDGDRATVVAPQAEPSQRAGDRYTNRWASSGRGEASADSNGDAPRASFLPDDAPGERYRAAEPAESDADASSAAETRSQSPFQSADSPRGGGDENDLAAEDAQLGQPKQLDEVPHAAALAPDRPRPSARGRNPLRKLSAEVPVDEIMPTEQAAPTIGGLYANPESKPTRDDVEPQPIDAAERQAIEQNSPPSSEVSLEPEPAEVAAPSVAQPRRRPAGGREAPLTNSVRPARATNMEPALPADGKYTVQPNDSLYLISEKVYGTGGYFKALAEHNRSRLPQVHRLTVGTIILVPPVSLLEQNYPGLCPKQRKSALVRPQAVQASARTRPAGGNVYIVEEGDTLFDIARYELGKATRWAEIYDLNRDVLGEDFDYLQPGTQLTMPPKTSGDALTRQRDTGYQR